MIESFACKETEKIFSRQFSRKLPQDIQAISMRKLWMLHASQNLQDLRVPPSNHLEKLSGSNSYSIRINKQWRICFTWSGNDAHNVQIIDYH